MQKGLEFVFFNGSTFVSSLFSILLKNIFKDLSSIFSIFS